MRCAPLQGAEREPEFDDDPVDSLDDVARLAKLRASMRALGIPPIAKAQISRDEEDENERRYFEALRRPVDEDDERAALQAEGRGKREDDAEERAAIRGET